MESGNTPVAAPRRRNVNDEESQNNVSSELVDVETPWEKFMKIHTQAYAATKEGMIYDEERLKDKAFNSYQTALELIDKAIQLSYNGGFSTQELNKVDEIVYKVRMTRKEILERISDLQHTSVESSSYLSGPSGGAVASCSAPANTAAIRQPPPYSVGNFSFLDSSATSSMNDQSIQGPSSTSAHTQLQSPQMQSPYGQLSSALDEIAAYQSSMPNPLPLNAQEVFYIDKEVQLYYIASDCNVSAPSYPSFLRVVVINKDVEPQDPRQPPAFIQCGDWTYPLVQNQSPLFKSEDGTYLFPDLTATDPGASVGLILPFNVTEDRRTTFEEILLQLVGLRAFPGSVGAESLPISPVEPTAFIPGELPAPTSRKLSSKIAEGLVTVPTQERFHAGAEYVAKGLQYGAVKTSVYLDKGASYLVTKMDPAKQKPVISSEVKSSVKTAKTVTGKAVQVSGYVVTQLSKGTYKLGQYLAPHIQSGATHLYASATKTSEPKASRHVNQVIEVAGGAVTGFAVVYSGLESAAKVLASSLANNTVQVVNHRYGTECGSLVGDAAETVGNTIVTGYNAKMLGPKAVIKRAAKDTGKAAITTKSGCGGGGSTDPPGPGPSS